jgi:hypothetical protein
MDIENQLSPIVAAPAPPEGMEISRIDELVRLVRKGQ